MTMVHCYMFEAKSIQSYIFRTGKLRDVVVASERLEQLIDTDDDILSLVLANFTNEIKFIRRKGGAFYTYGDSAQLIELRKIWTLAVQQLFPMLDFVDGIGSGENLIAAIESAQVELVASRNAPRLKVPLYTTNMKLTERTAQTVIAYDKKMCEYIDNDTSINRYAYTLMITNNATQFLYLKFMEQNSNQNSSNNPSFPLNLEPQQDFPYKGDNHDLALIHIDGNGIGLLLRDLKTSLANLPDEEYARVFLAFSDVLALSTIQAAQVATNNLIKTLVANNESINILPMRPIVMGGDDITLLCRADLAIEYAQNFCLAFERETKKSLKKLYKKYTLKDLPSRLTASGGIIFQKATQPFTTSHHLVEELCHQAKISSKANIHNKVGTPAIAFMQIATAQEETFARLMQESYQVRIENKTITTSLGNYLISNNGENNASAAILSDLLKLVELIRANDSPLPANKIRKVISEIHKGNLPEAESLLKRAEDILDAQEKKKLREIKTYFNKISGNKISQSWWLWDIDDNNKQTILSDILTLIKMQGGQE